MLGQSIVAAICLAGAWVLRKLYIEPSARADGGETPYANQQCPCTLTDIEPPVP